MGVKILNHISKKMITIVICILFMGLGSLAFHWQTSAGSAASDTTESEIYSRSRESVAESEGNNDFSSADTISGSNPPHTITGQLQSLSDIDIFKISLDGDYSPVDNLTVKINNLNSNDQYYQDLYISIYSKYENEYLLMKVVSCRVRDYIDCPAATIYAFDSGYYYIKLTATATYIWATDPISYSLQVSTDSVPALDNNQKIDTADEILGPITGQTLYQDIDLFDWYYIDVSDPLNYETNFSLNIEITKSKDMVSDYNNNNQMVSFVPELHVLIYHTDSGGTTKDEEVITNKYKKYDQIHPVRYFNHYKKSTQLSFYIGLYIQTYGRLTNGDGEYIAGGGHCDGWIEYSISKTNPKPMISPVINDAEVKSPLGKIYDSFTYYANYSDENNDRPETITILIDNGKIGPEPMIKVDDGDKNYQDGCLYKYTIDGSSLDSDKEEHEFLIYAEDVERKAVGDNSLHGKRLIGPIITNNILPAARPSAENSYTLYEDDPASYLDLNTTFEDPDNNTLYYRLSSDNKDWSNIYSSENITIKVLDYPLDPTGRTKYLEFQPKDNMFNREPGHTFGSEIVYINVSDEDPKQQGGINRAHYMWKPFELEVIIIGVNDPPQLKSSFYSYFKNAELELAEDHSYKEFNLNNIFWDMIENDPLTFTVRDNTNIDVRFYTNGTVDFIPKENWTGIESLEIIANDGFATVSDTLRVKVTPVNDNPVLDYIPKQIISEDEWFNITFHGIDLADAEPVYFETDLMNILELSEDEYVFDPLAGTLSFKPNNNNVGSYKDIKVTVRDNNGGLASQYVVFEIKNSPDPPEPIIISPKNDERFLDTFSIDFQANYYDPDNEILLEEHTIEWYSDKDGLLSTEFNFRTTLSEGIHTIKFKVYDPVYNSSDSIMIRILAVNSDDLDEDGIPNYWEILYQFNENNPRDAGEDPDRDTYSNYEEYLGMNGKTGGNDDTDPWDPEEHPDKHIKQETNTNENEVFPAIIIVIVIIVVLIIFFFMYRKKSKKAEEEAAAKSEKPEEIWQDMYGRKYKEHKFESIDVVCHNCLEKVEVENPIRPLVVTCNKCGKRGVLYK